MMLAQKIIHKFSTVALISGGASNDAYTARVAETLKRAKPSVSIVGVTGDQYT